MRCSSVMRRDQYPASACFNGSGLPMPVNGSRCVSRMSLLMRSIILATPEDCSPALAPARQPLDVAAQWTARPCAPRAPALQGKTSSTFSWLDLLKDRSLPEIRGGSPSARWPPGLCGCRPIWNRACCTRGSSGAARRRNACVLETAVAGGGESTIRTASGTAGLQ